MSQTCSVQNIDPVRFLEWQRPHAAHVFEARLASFLVSFQLCCILQRSTKCGDASG